MTIEIFATPAVMARACLDRELAGVQGYDPELRRLAEEAVANYHPAYVRRSVSTDTWTTNAIVWAMGGKIGNPALDPVETLRGFRQVMNWQERELRQIGEQSQFRDFMLTALRNSSPVNAMAQLDRELLLTERGITEKDVLNG